jgi:hypothetical protein
MCPYPNEPPASGHGASGIRLRVANGLARTRSPATARYVKFMDPFPLTVTGKVQKYLRKSAPPDGPDGPDGP